MITFRLTKSFFFSFSPLFLAISNQETIVILSPLDELVRIKIFSICVHLLVALSWSSAGEIKVFNYDSGGQ